MKDTIVLTHAGMAEARDARAHLESLGWQVLTVPEAVCLWDEAALTAFAEPLAGDLAGVIHPAPEPILGSVESVGEADWDRATNEGPMAAWCVTKVFCGLMARNGGGSMIYLNSIHAEKPVGMGSLYSMGCGAVQMLSREVAQDYGEFNVRAYFIQKGISETDPDGRSPVSSLYYGADLRYSTRRMPEAGYLNDLIAFLLTLTGVDESKDQLAGRLDIAGILTLSTGVFCIAFYITQGPDLGFTGTTGLVILSVSVASLIAFVIVEKVSARPMFDFSVFGIRPFSGAIIGSAAMNISFWPFMIYLPIWMQAGLGYDSVTAGLALLAYTVPTLVMASVAKTGTTARSFTPTLRPSMISASESSSSSKYFSMSSSVAPTAASISSARSSSAWPASAAGTAAFSALAPLVI